MKNRIIVGVIILLVIIIILLMTLVARTYKPFRVEIDPDNFEYECVTYYKECVCLGNLFVMESYPPQFDCKGLESCRDIEETECDLR